MITSVGLSATMNETIDEAWTAFSNALPNVASCVPSVHLTEGTVSGEGDAEYIHNEQRIRVRTSTPSETLRESVIHELAHHADATCGMPTATRAAFLEAQGFSADAAWDCGDAWETTPAEHFAEAIVQIVSGQRSLAQHLVELSPETLDLVREWEADS